MNQTINTYAGVATTAADAAAPAYYAHLPPFSTIAEYRT